MGLFFYIVAIIVGWIAVSFYDIPTALGAGAKTIEIFLLGGLLFMILNPVLDLFGIFLLFSKKLLRLFQK